MGYGFTIIVKPTKGSIMKIEQMDRTAVKTLSAAIKAALADVAAEYGVNIDVAGGSFDPGAGTFKPKVAVTLDGSAEREFRAYAELYGLSGDHFGREFATGGKRFRISGLAPRSPKRPILATEIGTDRVYKFPEDVRRLLGEAVAS